MADNSKAFKELIEEIKGQNQITIKKENGILNLVLNRPGKFNSLSMDMYISIGEAIDQASKDPEVKVIVFSGNGKYFCSGNDLTGFMKMAEKFPDFAENAQRRVEASEWMAYNVLKPFIDSFINCQKPIIAAVHGFSIGIGFSILGLCDIVYCTKETTFYGPFIELAQGPEACSSHTFHKIMGKSKANELLLFGERLKADEAFANHFVSKVFGTKEEMMDYALKKAKTMEEFDTDSLLQCKRLIMEEERKVLNEVNEKELKNLVLRWSSENLLVNLSKAFFSKKAKSNL